MEVSMENKMLKAVMVQDAHTVEYFLSKGANPNKTVSNGKTCLGEAAFSGCLPIVKMLIDASYSDAAKPMCAREAEYVDKLNTKTALKTFKRKLKDQEDEANLKSKNDRKYYDNASLKPELNQGYYVVVHDDSSSSEESKAGVAVPMTPTSPQSDLEWDEDLGKVAPTTKEDETVTSMYKWYAAILESTGAAIEAASNYTCGIDQQDAFGKTALNYAVDESHTEIIKALVKAGCKLDVTGSCGWTPLHLAVLNWKVDIVKLLLESGSNVNFTTPQKTTPLHIAVISDVEMISVLLDHGAVIDARDERERTPLYIAASKGKTDIVEYLILRGANANIGDGHTPLCKAVAFKQRKTVEELLRYGARITHFQCLLHRAIEDQDIKMVKTLASYGCGINVHNSNGDTPLLVAASLPFPHSFIQVLLDKGAYVNACNSHTGASVLHVAVEFSGSPIAFETLLRILLNYSVDMDIRAPTYDTALNRAILLHKDEVAMQLIRYGANVNLCYVLTNVFGEKISYTLLMKSSRRDNNKLADMLIKAGHNMVQYGWWYSMVVCITPESKPTMKWVSEACKNPLSLLDICRIAVRMLRGRTNLPEFVSLLPVPVMIKDYLMMREFEVEGFDFNSPTNSVTISDFFGSEIFLD